MIFMILRLLFIIASNLYCIPAYFAWMLVILPFRAFIPRLYDAIEGTLFSWLLMIVSSWIWLGNVTVEEAGDDLTELLDKKCLVMCNHQSTSDVPLLIYYLTSKPRVARTLSWIMDIMFKYSHFGLVSQVHHDYFIRQGRDTRDEQLLKLKSFLVRDFSRLRRNWLMLFPEGGFLYKRLLNSQKYATKHGYVHLDYCTLPRTGAIECVLETLVERPNRMVSQITATANQQVNNNIANSRNIAEQQQRIGEKFEENLENILREGLAIEWIIDLTICYPKANALSIFDLLTQSSPLKAPLKILILCRKYPISEVNEMTSDQLKNWLYNRWAEKDEMLRKFYETGDPYLPELTSTYLSTDNRSAKQTEARLSKSKDAPNGIHPPSTKASQKNKEMDDDNDDVGSLPPPKLNMMIKTSRPVHVSWKKFVLLHGFFLASTCFHYFMCQYSMSQTFLYAQSFMLRHPYLVDFLLSLVFNV